MQASPLLCMHLFVPHAWRTRKGPCVNSYYFARNNQHLKSLQTNDCLRDVD